MDTMEMLGAIGIVPVAVIEETANAVPAANAMAEGGINAIEITLRTKAGLDSIEEVAKNCKNVIVGAGTVITLDDEKKCIDKGAKFIVSPGFNKEMADWSYKNNIPYLPGCVTPTEIMEAMECGIEVVKFFPANIYGGLAGMKALSGPFPGIKFLPTGGISEQNVAEYLSADFIHAVGGSWVCSKMDISAGNYERIKMLSKAAVNAAMGYEVAHVGINNNTLEEADKVANMLKEAFGFESKEGNSSIFSSSGIEVMKLNYLGRNGHLAVRTSNVARAIRQLSEHGYQVDSSTYKYKNDKLISVYLKNEIGGFAIHLLQK